MLKFNISPSSMNSYCDSQITFYYNYIENADPDTDTPKCYGLGGSIVHEVLEDSETKNPSENFHKQWEENDLDNMMGINGHKLKKSDYLNSVVNGLKLLRRKYKLIRAEEKIIFPLVDNEKALITMKGIIDVQAELLETGEFVVMDYKTSSRVDSGNNFLRQAKFYSLLIYKKYGILPKKTIFEYVKINKSKEHTFTVEELLDFEQEIIRLVDEIIKKGRDISKYELGDSGSIFNEHRLKCLAEKNRREGNAPAIGNGEEVDWINIFSKNEIKIIIQNNYCFIENADNLLLEGLDREFKYNLKNKYWMQRQSMVWNRGVKPDNYDDIGTKHLFDKNIKRFSIGSLERVKKVIKQYSSYKKININMDIVDRRDLSVRKKLGIMPDKLKTDKVLRDYQIKGIEAFMNKGMGYIEAATGSGKTIVTAEIIRKLDTKTLWCIDRKELLYQTKEEFESLLGIKIGMIGDGEEDLQNITVATIQTLAKRKNQLKDCLSSINFIIIDEGHHGSSQSYQDVCDYLRNTQYRLATTATAFRDDGMQEDMFSLFGDIIYKIGTKELIKKGYLIKPKVIFYRVKEGQRGEEYTDDYTKSVVENIYRNALIKYVCPQDKKVLILTKIVNHGHALNEMIPNSKFIHGSLNKDDRKKWMEDFKKSKLGVLIATVSIASEGLDIPDLGKIINASANKTDGKSIQVIGRILRKIKGKKEAIYIDFIDVGRFTQKHSSERMKAFKREGHEIIVEEIDRKELDLSTGYFE